MISKIGNRGYLLLELTITITILSLGLVLILGAFSSSVKATRLSQDITRACFLAEDKIEELEIKINKGIRVAEHGEGKEGNIIWNYEIIGSEDESELKILTFQVFRQTVKKEKILEVNTYLISPI